MKIRTNYHAATGTLSVAFKHSEADGVFSATSSHNTIWDMKPEQWLEVMAEVRRAIDAVQLAEAREHVGGLAAELAEKIATTPLHG